MGVKLIDKTALIEMRRNSGQAQRAVAFAGSARENLRVADREPLVDLLVNAKKEPWVGSEGQDKMYREMKELKSRFNAAQAPDDTVLRELVSRLFVDITRRAQESPDLTSLIATEVTDFDFPEFVPLRDVLKYRGEFQIMSGSNDSVPLIEQNLATVQNVQLKIKGLGWKDSLKNMLFNPFNSMIKVLEAVTDADTDARNAATVGAIVGATYVASQQQAADATSGATYDVKMYNTLRKAVKKLMGLKDILTDRPISAANGMSLLVNYQDAWSIERVIAGQLQTGGTNGTLTAQNVQGLPIQNVIVYDRGINDGFTWGEKIMSFPGVPAGKAYLFVPREYFWVGTKRPLTMEMGAGSTLQLSTEERAWYRVQGEWLDRLLGSSAPGFAGGAGYGAVIEITLPADA